MKKYLMTGIAALALCVGFTSCSHDLESLSQEEIDQLEAQKVVEKYNRAFIATFGQPAANQNWGFGPSTRTRSGNTTAEGYVSYPATHQYTSDGQIFEEGQTVTGTVIAGANMNHNEWADPDKYYGGWVVPDPLTEGQKLRVKLYFQTHPNLSYQDPNYAHFFVQQVYTGGTDPLEGRGNEESTAAADGTVHAGATLNQLTVGQACSHINDFNAGTCTESDVLDNGQVVNGGTTHKDQITLMVNVDDTSCFGYHETGGSNVKGVINHNDMMALVSAATIDEWATSAAAQALGVDLGDPVVDKWNRSFMGFDYELLPEEDIIPENPTYAKFTDVPSYNNFEYVVLNNQVMKIGTAPEATEAAEVDITATFAQNTGGQNSTCSYSNGKIVCNFNGQYYSSVSFTQTDDWSQYSKLVIEFDGESTISGKLEGVGAETEFAVGDTSVEVACSGNKPYIAISTSSTGTLTIKSVKLVKEASTPDSSITYFDEEYLLGEGNKVMFYSSDNTNQYGGIIIEPSASDWTTSEGYLNLDYFKGLAQEGYHPLSGSAMKKWVKWTPARDYYYSDWIVTLTQARRIGEVPPGPGPDPDPDPEDPFVADLRIMAEDLSATEKSDYDFNDIVFDIQFNREIGTTTKIQKPARIRVKAAGGTLPLRIKVKSSALSSDPTYTGKNGNGWQEVHALWNKSTGIMINTNATQRVSPSKGYEADYELDPIDLDYTVANAADAKNITIEVLKNGQWIEMVAEVGMPAAKFACTPSHDWAEERISLSGNSDFEQWVQGLIGEWQWY